MCSINCIGCSRSNPSHPCYVSDAHIILIVLLVGEVAGAIILSIGGAQLLGSVGSTGFIAAMVGGGVLTGFSTAGLLAVVIATCKKMQEMGHAKASADQGSNTHGRVTTPVEPFPYIDLPSELGKHIFSFSSIADLGSIGQVSKACNDHMHAVIVDKACSYGYEGSDFNEACDYIKKFFAQLERQFTDTNPELIAENLKNIDIHTLYEIYVKLSVGYTWAKRFESNFLSYTLLTKYLLKLVKDKVVTIPPLGIGAKKDHNKPLIIAATIGEKNLVELLLMIGVDPNLPGENGSAPLHFAAQEGHDEIIPLLISHGANIKALGEGKDSVLMYAMATRRPQSQVKKTVEVVLRHGLDPNYSTSAEESTLGTALYNGFDEVAALLIEKGAVVGPLAHFSVFGETQKPHTEETMEKLIKVLLKSGADLNRPNRHNCNLLIYLAIVGYDKVICLLLDNGVDINTVDPSGHSALYYAAKNKHKSTIRLLLQRGANATALVDFI
jgi:ankyrin repeat protein